MNRAGSMVALVVAALALRLAVAPAPSFWIDEAFTVNLLDRGFGAMFDRLAQTESTPPLYYALAWLWTRIAGLEELGVRSLSVLAGAVTVGLAALLGRTSGVPRAGLAVGALVAVNPFLMWFSTEARAYALSTALTSAALLVLVTSLAHSSSRRMLAWGALAALAVCTHYATVFALAPQAALLLWRHRRPAAGAAVALVALTGLALAPLAIAQRSNEHARLLSETSGSLITRIAQLPKQFMVSYDSPGELPLAALSLVVVAVGVLAALRSPAIREWTLTLLGLAGLTVVVPAVLGLAGVADLFSSRYLLPALVPLLAVAGAGLLTLPLQRVGAALAVALAAVWLTVDVVIARDPLLQTKADWQGLDRAVGPAPRDGRAIVVTPASGAFVMTSTYRPGARYEPGRPVREITVTAAVSRGDDLPSPSPIPPATTPPPFAALGFELVEQRVERAWTLQRWRAPAPVTVDRALLVAAPLDVSRETTVIYEP